MKMLKKNFIFLLIIVCFIAFILYKSSSVCNEENLPEQIVVKYVIDGDTFVGMDGIHYRLIGIDTPEVARGVKEDQPFAQEAKKFTFKAIYRKKVYLNFDNQIYDKYNRRLVYVYITKSQMLNEMLLEKGLAKVFRRQDFIFKRRFYNIQSIAKKSKLGLWQYKKDRI